MRGLAVVVALAIAGLVPGAASAESLAPTPAELQWSRSVAVAYWHVSQPPCGRETVLLEAMPEADTALAHSDQCSIGLNAASDWRDFPMILCRIYVHEFGHLVLGATYFAGSNPANPAHSPDPNNVMYGAPTWQQQEVEAQSVGCLPLPVALPSTPSIARSWAQPKSR
jgi:hypothetical protein